MLAVAFRFLDDASPRVGSIEYLERYGSRGLTTLQQRDVTVEEVRTTEESVVFKLPRALVA